MTRFAVVGAGWRAEFYLRVAAALPALNVTRVMTTNAERAAEVNAFGVKTVGDYNALLEDEPDFVVAAPAYSAVPEVIEALVARDVPVLAETPPAPTLERLQALLQKVGGARVGVAEQYLFQPEHAARLEVVRSGLLGEVSHAQVSSAHGYHGMSLIRRYLGISFEEATVRAVRHATPAVAGPGRGGPPSEAKRVDAQQTLAVLDFGGKWAVFDFTMEQYFSWIRSSRVLVRGERGEIKDDEVRYLLDFETPAKSKLERWDLGHGGNLEGYSHRGITLGERWVYRNPFEGSRLSDDEIAVATCLEKMGEYVRGGPNMYSLAEAAQDAYLAHCVEQAVTKGEAVVTSPQSWRDA